jgi:hypothetical protein
MPATLWFFRCEALRRVNLALHSVFLRETSPAVKSEEILWWDFGYKCFSKNLKMLSFSNSCPPVCVLNSNLPLIPNFS